LTAFEQVKRRELGQKSDEDQPEIFQVWRLISQPAPTRAAQPNQESRPKSRDQDHLPVSAAAIIRSANADHQHGKGKQHKEELNVLAADLGDGYNGKIDSASHDKLPLKISQVDVDAPKIVTPRLQNRLQKTDKTLRIQRSPENKNALKANSPHFGVRHFLPNIKPLMKILELVSKMSS
jgi:hypothetical protein